jgi:regulator of replication initiation timing
MTYDLLTSLREAAARKWSAPADRRYSLFGAAADEIEKLRQQLGMPLETERETERLRRAKEYLERENADLRAERDAFAQKAGECHAGYQTLEKELAAAQADATAAERERCAKICDEISSTWPVSGSAKQCAVTIRRTK